MGKAVRPARVHREVRSGDGCEGRPAGRAGEFATSSLSDLSKNRDYLKYYVSRSPEIIVELRSARYSF